MKEAHCSDKKITKQSKIIVQQKLLTEATPVMVELH